MHVNIKVDKTISMSIISKFIFDGHWTQIFLRLHSFHSLIDLVFILNDKSQINYLKTQTKQNKCQAFIVPGIN